MRLEAALAVTRYTLTELYRRRVILVFVVIGLLLTIALGVIPFLAPAGSFPTGEDRSLFLLNALSSTTSLAIEVCAFAVGMTIINHDLDSGAIIAIFAKPISRLDYTIGKLLSGAVLLIAVDSLIAAGSILLVALNGGGHIETLFWFYVVTAANVVLFMVLLMILTVYLNNIVSAVIVIVYSFLQSFVLTLHTLVQNHFFSNSLLEAVINFFYWAFPHPLLSNLQRDIVQTQLRLNPLPDNPNGRSFDILSTVPGPSSIGEVLFWFAYLIALCALLYLAVRRKQV